MTSISSEDANRRVAHPTRRGRTVHTSAIILLFIGHAGTALAHHSNPLFAGGLGRTPPLAGAPTAQLPIAHLNYYGGRVVSNLQVVQVLYGSGSYLSNVSSTSSLSMATFYQGVLNSVHVDWLTEYNSNITAFGGGPGTDQIIGRGSF